MMECTGLHILLTYQCNFTCDHCFVWGSPSQTGTWKWQDLKNILQETRSIPSFQQIYFEGGEPFLYYPLLLKGIQESSRLGFHVGLVSNAYWATSEDDARLWLEPMAGMVDSISISSDLYHEDHMPSQRVDNAVKAAHQFGISTGVISIAQPQDDSAPSVKGMLPDSTSEVRYRGRAAAVLADQSHRSAPWTTYDSCPYEDLRHPSRVHIDPLGYIHICQGITAGNAFQESLAVICDRYRPDAHPIVGPLLQGGPAELYRTYNLPVDGRFADACHLCDTARHQLRERFPGVLVPAQMYSDRQ